MEGISVQTACLSASFAGLLKAVCTTHGHKKDFSCHASKKQLSFWGKKKTKP